MYLTEEEAKGKWCPQVRFTRQTSLWNWLRNISTYIANRYLKNRGNELSINESSKCIASECMMWRTGQYRLEKTTYSGIKAKTTYEHCPNKDGAGYCGLAGKPE